MTEEHEDDQTLRTNVRYPDAYPDRTSAIQITEQEPPLATVQSGQNYNYLLRQRTNGLLK